MISEGQEEQTHKKRTSAERTLFSALKNPQKFIMASHHPMLPNEPIIEEILRERMRLVECGSVENTGEIIVAEYLPCDPLAESIE